MDFLTFVTCLDSFLVILDEVIDFHHYEMVFIESLALNYKLNPFLHFNRNILPLNTLFVFVLASLWTAHIVHGAVGSLITSTFLHERLGTST